MSNPTALVQKLWNYCNILRDNGLSYGDYVEQLTFLLFLKMADEQVRPPFDKPSSVPAPTPRRADADCGGRGAQEIGGHHRFQLLHHTPPPLPPPVHFAESVHRSTLSA